jgi:hypothetical protein
MWWFGMSIKGAALLEIMTRAQLIQRPYPLSSLTVMQFSVAFLTLAFALLGCVGAAPTTETERAVRSLLHYRLYFLLLTKECLL